MLFLLNQEVIDLGDPVETLRTSGVYDVTRMPTMARLVALGQDAAFAGRGMEHAHVSIRRTLAALLTTVGQANCAMFLCAENARSPREVAVRLGAAPITTLAMLLTAQQNGTLTAAMINHHVWRVASSVAAA